MASLQESDARFVLSQPDRELAVRLARAAVREIWKNEIRETHACLYMAAALQRVLLTRFGMRTMLQAGTCQWPMCLPEEDDGVRATHFSYQWEANSAATRRNIVEFKLPEMHVWLGYRDPRRAAGLIIDPTTGSWPARARLGGYEWTTQDPPDFLWTDTEGLRELADQYGYGVIYWPDLTACRVADAFACHGIYGPLLRVDSAPQCEPGCKGWEVYNEDVAAGELGVIQCCDDCVRAGRPSPTTDEEAACLARKAGYTVETIDGRHHVVAVPS